MILKTSEMPFTLPNGVMFVNQHPMVGFAIKRKLSKIDYSQVLVFKLLAVFSKTAYYLVNNPINVF